MDLTRLLPIHGSARECHDGASAKSSLSSIWRGGGVARARAVVVAVASSSSSSSSSGRVVVVVAWRDENDGGNVPDGRSPSDAGGSVPRFARSARYIATTNSSSRRPLQPRVEELGDDAIAAQSVRARVVAKGVEPVAVPLELARLERRPRRRGGGRDRVAVAVAVERALVVARHRGRRARGTTGDDDAKLESWWASVALPSRKRRPAGRFQVRSLFAF
eukprot:29180-Pelagococcus_subviridis.AAC.2